MVWLVDCRNTEVYKRLVTERLGQVYTYSRTVIPLQHLAVIKTRRVYHGMAACRKALFPVYQGQVLKRMSERGEPLI